MRDTASTAVDLPIAQVRSHEAPARRWLALPVLLAGTFVMVLDFFIVNVALPSIQAELRVRGSTIEWVVAGYGLTFAIFLITAGRAGDQFGQRRLLLSGFALFTLASAACGLAPDAGVLIGARLLQGMAAAMISPSVLSLIGVIYTGADRVRAVGVYALVMGIAAAGGQLIGGALMQADIAGLGWRMVFLINLPVGLAALGLAPRLIPESRAVEPKPLDLVGLALVTVALTVLVVPLIEGPALGWPAWSVLCLAAAPVLLVGFAAHQVWIGGRGVAPLLDLGAVP